jgi:ATP-dependent DNA helicase RecQ
LQKELEILKKYWGFSSFRKGQDKIIESVLQGNDTLALLPTGGGKSLCYQIPGLSQEGLCLVISPLIALMHDQVKQLQSRGIKAVAITAGMNSKTIDIELDNAIYGQTKFLYVSPERLKSKLFRVRLEKMNINLIAVDEAHCISEWGYDFRPAYRNISELREIKPKVNILALTATATPEVVKDIQANLNFKAENVYQNSFERQNLIYKTVESNNKLNRIQEYLRDNESSGIVYCKTRKAVKTLCQHLISIGIKADFYHGGLEFKARLEKQEAWINNQTQIIVCTNAFGMGIDKPDVRFVLHYDIPETIEAYFQEAGRAGRDGKSAEAVLFYEPSDIEELRNRIDLKYPPIQDIKKIYNALGNYFQIAIGSGKEESYPIDLIDFCDTYKFDLITVYNALKFLEIGENLSLSENLTIPSKLKITTNQMGLYQHQVKNEDFNKVIQFILRTQMGVFEDLVPINESKISKHTGLSLKRINEILTNLQEKGTIQYIPNQKGTYITYITERLSNDNVHIPNEVYHKRRKVSKDKAEKMIEYLQSNRCTNIFLLEYFGEKDGQQCKKCDRCKQYNEHYLKTDLKKVILNYINNQFKIDEEVEMEVIISAHPEFSKAAMLEFIRELVDNQQLSVDSKGKKIRQKS